MGVSEISMGQGYLFSIFERSFSRLNSPSFSRFLLKFSINAYSRRVFI